MASGGKRIGGASDVSGGEHGRLGDTGADCWVEHARTLATDWF